MARIGLPFHHPLRRWLARLAKGPEIIALRARCQTIEPYDVRRRARLHVQVLRQIVRMDGHEFSLKPPRLRRLSSLTAPVEGEVVIRHPARPIAGVSIVLDDDIVEDGIVMGSALFWTGEDFVGVLLPTAKMIVGRAGMRSRIPEGAIDPFELC